MSRLTGLLLAAAAGASNAAAAQEQSLQVEPAERTAVILEHDCGDFSSNRTVKFCIKSSAWEMHDMALNARDTLMESGIGLGQGLDFRREIEEACNPRIQLRNRDDLPRTITEFRDVTVSIMDDCARTLRSVEKEANEILAEDGSDNILQFDRAHLGLLSGHAEWLGGLDLSEFEIVEEQPEERPDAAIILQIPG